MDHLVFLFATHFLGDFPFQSEWMVINKGKSREVLGYHVAVYVGTNYLLCQMVGFHPTLQGLAVDGITHFIIDTLKCRGVIKQIWQDQLCHLLVRTTLWYLGWL